MAQRTLTGLFKEKALVMPNEKVVYVWGEFDLTYAQLWELVDHAAALLMGQAVGAGDVVALAFPTTVEFLIMLLAVMRCRATAAPLNPAYSAEEFTVKLSRARLKLLLTPQEGNELAHLAASKLNIPCITAKLDSADSKITLSSTDIELDFDSLSKVVNDSSDAALFLYLRATILELTQLDLTERAYLPIQRYTWPAYTNVVWDLLVSLVAGDEVVLPLAREASSSGPSRFSYDHLFILNGKFRDSRVLGAGGSGRVYEGYVYIGYARTRVAVKFIRSDSAEGIKEFASEVMTLSQLSHPNLVQLLGYCDEPNKLVLIYEFMSGGTLDDRLFNEDGAALTWASRQNIIQGLVSALRYMHEGSDIYVIHRDLKSSNIMLDEELRAKIGDFGLARLVDCTTGPKTTNNMGTHGYAPLDYCFTGKATKETDVFSFGVVLLELGSGRRVIDEKRDPKDLVSWVWKKYGNRKLLDAVDRRLSQFCNEEQVKILMMVGLWCAHPIAISRPSIAEAEAVLKGDAKPPKLPSNMPRSQYDDDLQANCSIRTCDWLQARCLAERG